MAVVYPDFMTISKLRTPATEGEFYILDYLSAKLDSSYEIFFNPFLDGDRPDIIILKKGHGAIIVEVKDWNLTFYSVTANNKWFVSTPERKNQPIKSPHQQAYHYKQNMFDRHLPILGLSESINSNFWKVIHPVVYFHDSSVDDINSLFNSALFELSVQSNELNNMRNKGSLCGDKYNKRSDYLSKKIGKINRDKRISFSTDLLDKLVKKINDIDKNILFSENIYEEFKRRLSPSDWTYLQGHKIEFDKTQHKYSKSTDELAKIKGVAGCGKTSILAARALDAYVKHGNVLILTFNITLKQLIRDKLSHLNFHSPNKADINKVGISNYHRFFLNQLNDVGVEIDIPKGCSKEESRIFWNTLVKDGSPFKGKKTTRYQSIFIDEIQDYEKEWITIIRDYFLVPGGEMILFGDHAQNIYQRDEKPLNKSIIRGFGTWGKLTRSYRLNINSLLVSGFKQFQEFFLQSRHDDLELFEHKMQQGYLNTDLIIYKHYAEEKINELSKEIDYLIKTYKLIPNDIAIISSRVEILRNIEAFFSNQEKTITTFVTIEDMNQLAIYNRMSAEIMDRYDGDILLFQSKANKTEEEELLARTLTKIERRKKTFFVQNSGLMKFSTIHSFKGMESKTIFCILHATDDPEIVYTAITRARENLILFDALNSNYLKFFNSVYGEA